MKAWARELALGLLLSAAVPSVAAVAAEPVQQILLDKANFWRLKDRPDLAVAALNQLLTLNPNQPDGLYQYGMIEAQQGHIAAAQRYLARLQAVSPSSPHVGDLENAIRTGQVSPTQLNEARRLAQQGEFAQAAQKYQQTFRGPPPTSFGPEYYLTLAGTAQGWDTARRGLEQLRQTAPNDPRINLALAQVLTYRQPTRHEGIEELAQLSRNPVVGAQAATAWRQALMWLGGSPSDRQAYAAYLAQYPQDTEVRQHMADVLRTGVSPAGGPPAEQAQGYAYLRHGETGAAERAFAAELRTHPGDPDALAGLGIIRLRQQRFAEARNLLGRAIRAAPGRRGQWQAAYDSAGYLSDLQAAKGDRDAGRYGQARAILSRLVRSSRSDSWNAELVLGDVDQKLGDGAGAEAAYRRVLAVRPRDPTATVGLFNALMAEGKTAEAATLSNRLATIGGGALGGAQTTRAEVLRAEAKNAEERGNSALALSQFQQAIATDPTDAWARLDFARFLARQGEQAQAFAIVNPVAAGNSPTAWYAAAIFDSEQNRFADAQAKMDRIPAGARTSAMSAFSEHIQVTAEIERAKDLARAGNEAEARDVLVRLYSQPPMTADKARLIAGALADLGDTAQALQILRENMARGGATGSTIDYAGLLLRTGNDAEAGAYIARLQAAGRLDTGDRRGLEHLKAEVAAHRADVLREHGDLAGAYDQISAMLAAYPNDPTLLLATGRIYAAAGRNSQAMSFFDAAYRQSPGDINVIRGAVGGAIVAHDFARASAYLARGLRLYPQNPRLYFLRAELARAEGDNGTAMQALRAAQTLDVRQAGAAAQQLPGAPPGSTSPLPPNPFRQSETTPPMAAPPAMAYTGVASPELASADTAAPLPADLQLAAVPADSEDLMTSPQAAPRPGQNGAPSGDSTLAAAAKPPAGMQLAELTGSDVPMVDPPVSQPAQTQLAQTEELAPLPPPPVAGYQPPAFTAPVAAAPQNSLEGEIQQSELAIESQNNPSMEGGLSVRYRDGESGLSRLVDVGVPVEGSFSPFYTGRVTLSATPTFLSAGTPGTSALPRFGNNPLLVATYGPNAVLPSPGAQDASGVAFSAGYNYRNFAGEIGTTPLGFPVDNLIGRLAFSWPGNASPQPALSYGNQYRETAPPPIPLAPNGTANPFQITIEGQRQPITDSLLSYAGTKDSLTGATWGGVVKTGGDLLVSYDDGEAGFYAGGGAGVLDGQSVESNSEFDGLVGGFIRPYRTADDAFKVGVNLTYFSYDKNLRFFTFGQGGYFSPQNYVNVGVPLEYSGRSGRLTYLIGGTPGLQAYDENSSPELPLSSSYLVSYPSRSVVGPSFDVHGQVEYQLHDGFALGALASVDNAEDYTEGIAKVYLRKTFGLPASTDVVPNTGPGSL